VSGTIFGGSSQTGSELRAPRSLILPFSPPMISPIPLFPHSPLPSDSFLESCALELVTALGWAWLGVGPTQVVSPGTFPFLPRGTEFFSSRTHSSFFAVPRQSGGFRRSASLFFTVVVFLDFTGHFFLSAIHTVSATHIPGKRRLFYLLPSGNNSVVQRAPRKESGLLLIVFRSFPVGSSPLRNVGGIANFGIGPVFH